MLQLRQLKSWDRPNQLRTKLVDSWAAVSLRLIFQCNTGAQFNGGSSSLLVSCIYSLWCFSNRWLRLQLSLCWLIRLCLFIRNILHCPRSFSLCVDVGCLLTEQQQCNYTNIYTPPSPIWQPGVVIWAENQSTFVIFPRVISHYCDAEASD